MVTTVVFAAVCYLVVCGAVLADAPETRPDTKVQREDRHEAAQRELRERETRRLLLALR